MERLLSALLQFYAPLLAALAYGKMRGAVRETVDDLSKITLNCFLPVLLFASVYRRRLGTMLQEAPFIMGAALFTIAASMAVGALLFRGDRELAYVSSFANAVYLPVPLAYVLWGPDAVSLIGFYALACSTTGNTLAPIMMGRSSLVVGLRRLAKYPPIYGIAAGLIAQLIGLELPEVVVESLLGVGSIATYLALIVLGLQASVVGMLVDADVAKVMGVRFVASPTLVCLLVGVVGSPSELATKVVLLESFMPPAVANVILANEFSSKPERVAKVVFGSTLAALAAIPAFLLALGI